MEATAMTQVADAAPNIATSLIDALIASNRGDRHAFSFNARRYSYQDVAALMNRTGNMVKGLGVEKTDLVLLLLPGSPALVASLLGVVKAGAVPVLGVPLEDAEALGRCVAATHPSAVIVHQDHLAYARKALSGISHDRVVVVGADAGGHKSFLDEVRGQSSWLAAEPVNRDAPALGIWRESALDTISHGEVAALIGDGDNGGVPRNAATDEMAVITAMLRAFSKGEEATLS
jgi:acyl-coenzyme A synthetase/AMP-(fatty) acid ligase